jgi:hypothetical protein
VTLRGDFLATSRGDLWGLPAVERGFSVDFSLVGRLGVFPLVALLISIACVCWLCCEHPAVCVCESLVGF